MQHTQSIIEATPWLVAACAALLVAAAALVYGAMRFDDWYSRRRVIKRRLQPWR